ncbi:MAG TPA: ABC transporter permease [Streptosporangiaceae bacterium]|jgi:ABC-2 type transport system permease protein
MRGTLMMARAEIMRVLRNKRYLAFTIALPMVLYLAVGRQIHGTEDGVSYRTFYMVAMAALGAFSGALMGNAQRISQERKEGWIRQLRLTALPAHSYVVAKVVAAMATSVPSIVGVLAVAKLGGGINLAVWQWVAIGAAVWVGTLMFSALAVAIGYQFMPDVVQPITMFVYLIMSVLGGIWVQFNSGLMHRIAEALPTYRIIEIGTDVVTRTAVPSAAMLTIAAWLVGFGALAVLSVRRTAETV